MITLSRALQDLEPLLKDGVSVHAFRSGGGLRVLNGFKDSKECAYGESFAVEDAIRIFVEDYKAGRRKYSDVYGKIEERFLTGTTKSYSDLDQWLLQGLSFDLDYHNNFFRCILTVYSLHDAPIEVIKKVCATKEAIVWKNKKGIFKSYFDKFGCATKRIDSDEPVAYTAKLLGVGLSISDAVKDTANEIVKEKEFEYV